MVYPHTYRTEHSETRTTNAEYGQYYAQSQSKKIKIQPQLLKILQYVDSNRVQIVQDLREAVEIQSTSDDLINKDNIINMVKFAEKWLLRLGVKYECFNIGTREIKGKRYKLPPVILGNIGSDKEKKTVSVHFLQTGMEYSVLIIFNFSSVYILIWMLTNQKKRNGTLIRGRSQ